MIIYKFPLFIFFTDLNLTLQDSESEGDFHYIQVESISLTTMYFNVKPMMMTSEPGVEPLDYYTWEENFLGKMFQHCNGHHGVESHQVQDFQIPSFCVYTGK